MNKLREIAYRVDPAMWVGEVLGISAYAWQQTFLRSHRGASILALTGRQVGKTTARQKTHDLRNEAHCRAGTK